MEEAPPLTWRAWLKTRLEEHGVHPYDHGTHISTLTTQSIGLLRQHGFLKDTAQQWPANQFEEVFGAKVGDYLNGVKP